jgi:hypothetical protein
MGEREWLSREDPERSGPVRNFSGLFQWSGSSAGSTRPLESSSSNSDSTGRGHGVSREEGVGLAYSVIEKHINDGKRNAEQFNNKSYNTRTPTDGLQEILERTILSQIELIPGWIDALGSAFQVGPTRKPYPPASPARSQFNGDTRQPPKPISIEVASVRPARVSINFSENGKPRPVVVLRDGLDETKPQLTGVSFDFDAASEEMTVRISVPDNQPPGVYSGVIVSRDTGEPLGTLSVRIAV